MITTLGGLGLVAAIPSPPDNAIGLGRLQLRAYGLAIAFGVVVAVDIARRRWAALTRPRSSNGIPASPPAR